MTALTKTFALFGTFACFAVALGLPTPVRAQSSISECEKIQAADAYNQCLAKFGPPAKTGNLEPERPGDIKSSSADAAATGGKPSHGKARGAGRRHGRGSYARRGHGGHSAGHSGRKRMTISVGKT